MVAIILCDDDPFTLQLLSELLERAIRQSKAEANLSVWTLSGRSTTRTPAGKSSLLPAMGRRAWIFCAAACGPLGLLKMCGSE